MKLFGSIFRKLSRPVNLQKEISNKRTKLVLFTLPFTTTIFICSLFYFLGKNTSFFPFNLATEEVSAKTITLPQQKTLNSSQQNDYLESTICHKSPNKKYTATNPTLEKYRFNQLCQKEKNNILSIKTKTTNQKDPWKEQVARTLLGTPMENMIESINQQEKIVAAFLVGIALKESHFGRHAPVKHGHNCFNYWGYKGRGNVTAGGYSCFSSPEEAVKTVGKRLKKLAIGQKRTTPQKMIIWKCGSSCASHSPQGVNKWIKDVAINFNRINQS